MVDAFCEKIVAKKNDSRATNVQPNSARDKNEIQPNLGVVPMIELMLASTTIGRHANEPIQLNLARVLVEYGVLGFTHEGGINTTWIGDVGNDSILAF